VGIDDKETTKAIRVAFEASITTFDTAEAYGKGHSERMLALATSDMRDNLIYATKAFSRLTTAANGKRVLVAFAKYSFFSFLAFVGIKMMIAIPLGISPFHLCIYQALPDHLLGYFFVILPLLLFFFTVYANCLMTINR
jgi:hypothetical protein